MSRRFSLSIVTGSVPYWQLSRHSSSSYGVDELDAIICTAAMEMNASPSTMPVSKEMLNCLNLRCA